MHSMGLWLTSAISKTSTGPALVHADPALPLRGASETPLRTCCRALAASLVSDESGSGQEALLGDSPLAEGAVDAR